MRRIIVAYSIPDRIMGCNGDLPWHLPGDMARFRTLTMNGVVIMGRKTYDGLPPQSRPLPGRHNVVLTRDSAWQPDCAGVEVSRDMMSALTRHQNAWIIGGEEIYRAALPHVDEIVATEVEGNFSGDVWFPMINHDEWQRKFLCHSSDEGWVQISLRRKPAGQLSFWWGVHRP